VRENIAVNRSIHKATMNLLIGTATGGALAAWNLFRWMHHSSPDARFNPISWSILFAISLISGPARLLYYRNHRDYFAKEMDHRSSLAKGSLKLAAKD